MRDPTSGVGNLRRSLALAILALIGTGPEAVSQLIKNWDRIHAALLSIAATVEQFLPPRIEDILTGGGPMGRHMGGDMLAGGLGDGLRVRLSVSVGKERDMVYSLSGPRSIQYVARDLHARLMRE